MKNKKLIIVIIAILTLVTSIGCSEQNEVEEPYVKYIITTYSGGKVIDTFEVYSDMQEFFRKGSVTIYNNANEEILLFYSTLDYKVEGIVK